MFLVDAHCDTVTTLMERSQTLFENDGHISLKKLKAFDGAAIFFAVWLNGALVANAFENTVRAIEFFKGQAEENSEYIGLATGYGDIPANAETGRVSGLLAVEGGEALEGSVDKLHALHALGVRSVTLTWNRQNKLGDPAVMPRARGLTAFGRQVVSEMNSLGMVVDVSHLSERGFWDVAERSAKPFIASHSNCLKLCGHKRNLSDEQLMAVAGRGGAVGVNLYPRFLRNDGEAGITDVLRHIDHMLCVAGESAVGLGGDFDGIDETPAGLEDVSRYGELYAELVRLYGGGVADAVFGGNFLRVLKDIMT